MNRRLPLILVAGVLALCLVGVIVVGISAGSGFGAVAYTVNDTKVSQQSVNDDLAEFADHDKIATAVFGNPFATTAGGVSSTGSANLITMLVQLDILRNAPGGKLSAEELRSSRADLLQNLQGDPALRRNFVELPRAQKDRIAEITAYSQAAQSSQTRIAAFNRALRRAHVTVDPRYGFWSPKRGQVCPPTGCPKQSASSSAGG